MTAYYNENNHYPAQWLRNLIAAGLIAPGDVDERSIVDVRADDLKGYTQCHFFAGIGGWSYALCLAGWPDDRPVWTGSCPCQPLSSAGQRKGHADERHLWPAFYALIAQCKPPAIFGEQVASKDGREWLSGVRADLEELGYAIGAADLCAAGVGAPHIRQRLFWLGIPNGNGRQARRGSIAAMGYRDSIDATDRQFAWLSDSEIIRPGTAQSRDGQTKTERRWSHPASSYRRFVDGFGNNYRIPESDVPFVVDGFPGILGQIGAYGNAIVPQVAAEFIAAYLEIAQA